ncbi:hypothetical protein FAGKG844_20313 [Frankia sp. AgKG'84/4]
MAEYQDPTGAPASHWRVDHTDVLICMVKDHDWLIVHVTLMSRMVPVPPDSTQSLRPVASIQGRK